MTAFGTLTIAAQDSATMLWRELKHTLRLFRLLFVGSIVVPVVMLLLFDYILGGAIGNGLGAAGQGLPYVDFLVPGILMMTVAAGSAATAINVCTDMTGGIVDRFRSLDVPGHAILAGHVVASAVRNTVSTLLVFGVALLIGFRPHGGPLDWAAAGGILLLFVLAISCLAAVAGLLASSPEAASGFAFAVMFLPYASSTFVPIHTMPSWLQGVARDQPVTPVVETLRGLLLGHPVGATPWHALAWCGGILAVAAAASGILFRRRTA